MKEKDSAILEGKPTSTSSYSFQVEAKYSNHTESQARSNRLHHDCEACVHQSTSVLPDHVSASESCNSYDESESQTT